ncbi:FMN-binding protein [Leuconostoc pseudomesenteroides]|uniref:FMN-binding protein n=1 Tax=Leuconostoc pseudomesenteroides TaxID=33968 RepID=UPI0021A52112|nr:FMN-binding protein [Leuconostoc pseudomesenteroides]MCT4380633.1 FMN-binding protein [Leuconostoc pseudomesenteroides]
MKKILAVLVTGLIAVAMVLDAYGLLLMNKGSSTDASATTTSQATTTDSTSDTTSVSSSSSTISTSSSSGKYKDGTYKGSSVSTQWGNVQVKVTISGGKITDVTMVHSTSEDGEGRSQAIDNQAEPVYISETKKAQSADIQAISGATVTYEGYTQSLQSALDKAV